VKALAPLRPWRFCLCAGRRSHDKSNSI